MPQSNYSRFADGVQIAGVSINVHQKGQVLYVCNSTVLSPNGVPGNNGADGKTPDRPLATIAAAIAKCVASRGDKIILLPGHAETITAAGGIALSVAGVSIIADPLAVGSQRPTITLGTANTATMTITANEVVVSGVLFVANFLNIATCINILATATDVTISQCEFRDTSAILNFVLAVTTSATANGQDGLILQSNRYLGLGTTAATSLLKVGAAINRLQVLGNSVDIQGTTATTGALVLATAHALTGVRILGNDLASNLTTAAGAQTVVAGTGGSGFMADNYVQCIAAPTDLLITASSGIGQFNNYQTGAADASGYILPAIDS